MGGEQLMFVFSVVRVIFGITAPVLTFITLIIAARNTTISSFLQLIIFMHIGCITIYETVDRWRYKEITGGPYGYKSSVGKQLKKVYLSGQIMRFVIMGGSLSYMFFVSAESPMMWIFWIQLLMFAGLAVVWYIITTPSAKDYEPG